MTYSEKLKDPRWQKMRLEILERDSFSCMHCERTDKELHVHHIKYSGNPWDSNPDDLITLCKDCHSDIERYKKSIKEWLDYFVSNGDTDVFFEIGHLLQSIAEHSLNGNAVGSLTFFAERKDALQSLHKASRMIEDNILKWNDIKNDE